MLRRLIWFVVAATIGWTVRNSLTGLFGGQARSHFSTTAETRASETAHSGIIRGKAITIQDGDTIDVRDDLSGQKIRIRLAYIDAPEIAHPGMSTQPYGPEAKRYLASRITGRTITITTLGKDQYGRTIGEIYLGDESVNFDLVIQGLAWAYRQYLPPSVASAYINAESQAREARRGLWADPSPTPPWDWRHTAK